MPVPNCLRLDVNYSQNTAHSTSDAAVNRTINCPECISGGMGKWDNISLVRMVIDGQHGPNGAKGLFTSCISKS